MVAKFIGKMAIRWFLHLGRYQWAFMHAEATYSENRHVFIFLKIKRRGKFIPLHQEEW